MKTLRQNENVIIICIIEAIIGILLLVNPIGFTVGIITVFGVALMVGGLLNVIRYFRNSPEEAAVGQFLMQGFVSLMAGSFCTFYPQWFIAAFPVIVILYGIAVLIGGFFKIQMTVDMLRLKVSKWWWGAISAGISTICAIIIISNPFSSTVALWWFTGISLIVEAIFDVVTLIVKLRNDKSK